MSFSLSKSLRLSSSLKMNEEAELVQKQGIVSILGSDCQRTLRRTLSADMSSKKWLTQNGFGFSPMKKIASSEALAVSVEEDSSSSSKGEYDERKEMEEKPTQLDIWSSIISEKAKSKSEPLPPPYIHPLVKNSASSLSKKSLEVCTESLGSETGSDGFSSYTPSETGDSDEDKEEEKEKQEVPQTLGEEFDVVKYNYGGVGRKSPPRSFPPPLLSLSHPEGASFSMRSRRDNGRLVLEAVSVPSQNNFHAQRQDGRLVLTFVPKNLEQKKMIMEEFEEEFEDFETENYDDEEEDHEEEDEEERVEKAVPKLASEVINVHKLAVMMKPQMAIAKNKNPWLKNFNELVKFEEEEEEVAEEPITLAQSLLPLPWVARLLRAAAPVAAAASFNAYEYYWRANPPPPPPLKNCKKLKANEQQQRLLVRGNKGGCLVPLLRGCKEPRRSLVFWKPQCIATS